MQLSVLFRSLIQIHVLILMTVIVLFAFDFCHNPGSSSASSCEGRTVNSYWLSQRKLKHTKHGGLMAKSLTSQSRL